MAPPLALTLSKQLKKPPVVRKVMASVCRAQHGLISKTSMERICGRPRAPFLSSLHPVGSLCFVRVIGRKRLRTYKSVTVRLPETFFVV